MSHIIPKRPFIYNPPQNDLNIIHIDDDLVVVEKPAGLLSVPGRPIEHKDSLASRVQKQHPTATVVHRLDLATSGLIVMPLHIEAHRHLSLQFEKRLIRKTYIADIWGIPTEKTGTVNQPLLVDWPNRPRQIVNLAEGKKAETHYTVTSVFDDYSRVTLKPITGRTHQLRVHMQHLGHPILGDELYAHDAAYTKGNRLHLHASFLNFTHPRGYTIEFTSKPNF